MYNHQERETIKNSVFYKAIIDKYHNLVEQNDYDPEKLDWDKDISKILDIMYYKTAVKLADVFIETGAYCYFDDVYSNITETITEVAFMSNSFDSMICQLYNWVEEMKIRNVRDAYFSSVLYALHREFTNKNKEDNVNA